MYNVDSNNVIRVNHDRYIAGNEFENIAIM